MREAQALVVDTLAATVDELCQKFGVWNTVYALICCLAAPSNEEPHLPPVKSHASRYRPSG